MHSRSGMTIFHIGACSYRLRIDEGTTGKDRTFPVTGSGNIYQQANMVKGGGLCKSA